jgi:uncharacterized membrane protein YkvA (DUF1232 family)
MWKRLTLLWVLIRGDARRLWFALRHPAAPGWLKPATALLLLYLISPLDLVPDALPVVGIVDDLVLLPLAVHWLLSMLPEPLRRDMDRRFGTPPPVTPGARRPGEL